MIGRLSRVLPLCLGACLLAACSGPAVLNALTPDEGYRVERDVPYGPDERQRLDLYIPADARPRAPLVVFFHGGGWTSGSKDLYPFVGQAFASRGYITAIPDYRLYPQVRYPGFLEDAAAAVMWLSDHLPHTGEGSGSRPVFLVGHSAGAYIAAMLALDQRWIRGAGGEPCRLIDAGVGLAGPYDFLPLEGRTLREIFGPGPAAPATQPIHHADRTDPPMLLVTGTDDETVRPGNTLRLAAQIREAGGRVEARLYDGLGHVTLIAALAAPLRFVAPVLDDIDIFLHEIASEQRDRC